MGTVSAAHTFADDKAGGYPVTLTVADKYGKSASKSLMAAVANANPTGTAGAPASGQAGTALTVALGSFTDLGYTFAPAGTPETFNASVTCGNGSPAEPATVALPRGSLAPSPPARSKARTPSLPAAHTPPPSRWPTTTAGRPPTPRR